MKFPGFGLIAVLMLAEANAFAPTKASYRRTPTRLKNLENLKQKTPDEEQVTEWLGTYGEKSRKYRRNVFSAGDWVRSRRPDRFISHIKTTFDSGLLRQLQEELTALFFVSLLVALWNCLFVDGFNDFSGNYYEPISDMIPPLELPLAPFTISVSALGLLLTFRTNVSYSRWNEARTAWGKVINDSRSIVRMGCTWARAYEPDIRNIKLQRLGEAVCSFSRSLMNRTLPSQEDEKNFLEYTFTMLSDQSYAEELRDAKHRPTCALAEITSCIVDLDLDTLYQVEVEQPVTGLCDALGASERIFTSPVPTFYTRHTARFLAFWLFSLPLGLYEPFKLTWNHWGMIPVTVLIGGFLLGIEELATQMEEPFSILPMEKMCEGSIRTPVMEQVERSTISQHTDEAMYVAPAEEMSVEDINAQWARGAIPQHTDEATYVAPHEEMSIEEINAQWARGAMGANPQSWE